MHYLLSSLEHLNSRYFIGDYSNDPSTSNRPEGAAPVHPLVRPMLQTLGQLSDSSSLPHKTQIRLCVDPAAVDSEEPADRSTECCRAAVIHTDHSTALVRYHRRTRLPRPTTAVDQKNGQIIEVNIWFRSDEPGSPHCKRAPNLDTEWKPDYADGIRGATLDLRVTNPERVRVKFHVVELGKRKSNEIRPLLKDGMLAPQWPRRSVQPLALSDPFTKAAGSIVGDDNFVGYQSSRRQKGVIVRSSPGDDVPVCKQNWSLPSLGDKAGPCAKLLTLALHQQQQRLDRLQGDLRHGTHLTTRVARLA